MTLALLAASALAQSAAFAPLNHKPLPPESSDFYFVALGDNRPAGAGLPPTGTFREILREVAILGPSFVISSGDLLYGAEESLADYQREEHEVQELVNLLPCPFYNAPGNHEVSNKPEFLAEYTKTFGAPYGKFEFGGVRFLGLCSDLPGPSPLIGGDQLAWLKGVLKDRKPTVAFFHHPVFARKPDPSDSATIANHDEIHRLFVDKGVETVLEGHDHIFNEQIHDGVHYMIAGGAGAPLDGAPMEGGFFHFALGHAHGGKIDLTPIPLGAIELYQNQPNQAILGSYADGALPVRNLRVVCDHEPHSVKATYSTKKAKDLPVEAKLLRVEKGIGRWVAVVALDPPAHRATRIALN